MRTPPAGGTTPTCTQHTPFILILRDDQLVKGALVWTRCINSSLIYQVIIAIDGPRQKRCDQRMVSAMASNTFKLTTSTIPTTNRYQIDIKA